MQRLSDDLWRKKATQLGLGRGQALVDIQARLERLFPGRVRAHSLNHGNLRIVTSSASVASELRLQQTRLLAELAAASPDSPITKLVITIGQLEPFESPD